MICQNYDAGELLDAMRPHIEKVLQDCTRLFPGLMPECPSQSQRASVAINLISVKLEQLHQQMHEARADFRQIAGYYDLQGDLQKFMAVHKTVTILEWKARNPGRDVFAP